MIIQELTVNNLCLTFPIGKAFSIEAGRPPFNDAVFSNLWSNLIESGIGKIYAALEYNPAKQEFGAVALLGATFLPDPFSGRMVAAEMFWFVVTEHRKSGIGLQLLDKFEADAKAKGCEQVVMVHFMHMGQGLAKLYEARGYTALEQTYKKEI